MANRYFRVNHRTLQTVTLVLIAVIVVRLFYLMLRNL